MCGSAPSAPKLPPPIPPPTVVDEQGESSKAAREKFNKQARAAQGVSSTIATGPLGVTEDPTVRRTTLLGRA
jgi:hypothetical protein